MPQSSKFSVLVVSYNVCSLLERCLRSVDPGTEVVVFDNASTDGSADLVRDQFPQCTLIASAENVGFSAGVNAAAAKAKGDLYLLLNPDAELRPHAQERMIRCAMDNPDYGAWGFRQVDGEGYFQLAVGPPPWLWADLVRRAVQRRLDSGDLRLGRWLDRILGRAVPVPWVAGSSMLLRREAFESVGGFDEEFFLFFEDIDFCLRLRREGWRVGYEPSVTVIHHRGRSAATEPGPSHLAYRRSQLRFWEKHRGPWIHRLVSTYLSLRGMGQG